MSHQTAMRQHIAVPVDAEPDARAECRFIKRRAARMGRSVAFHYPMSAKIRSRTRSASAGWLWWIGSAADFTSL